MHRLTRALLALVVITPTWVWAEDRRPAESEQRGLAAFPIEVVRGRRASPVVEPKPVEVTATPKVEARRFESDTSPRAKAFRAAATRLLNGAPLGAAAISVAVVDVKSGREVFAKEPALALNPASVVKLFTSAVALDRLGPDHRFETAILVDGDTVFARGGGDPMLTQEELLALVAEARKKLGTVRRVVVDASAFGGASLPPGYGKKNTDAPYRASTAALALDSGVTELHIVPTTDGQPPKVISVRPAGGYLLIKNEARTVQGPGATIRVRVRRQGERSEVVVTGRIGKRRKPMTFFRRIDAPGLAAGYVVAHALGLGGQVSLGKTPPGAKLAARRSSKPLREILAVLNKQSDNFIAETLVRSIPKTSGAHWEAGRAVVRQWLADQVGLDPARFSYQNGSGLYEGGRFSSHDVVRLLLAMDRHRHREVYRGSLSVAGQDGTLKSRLRDSGGRVLGKTGTLDQVSALAGYVRGRSGRWLAVSVLVNEPGKGARRFRGLQDQLVRLALELL